jgi:hypothetical protein
MAFAIGIAHPTFRTCLSHCRYFFGLPGGAINSPYHQRRLLYLTASLSRSHVLDHLSLVAGMFRQLGIGDVIGRAMQQHPEMRVLTVGEAVKAMVLVGLGCLKQALSLVPRFFHNKLTYRMVSPHIAPEQLNDDALGRIRTVQSL